MNRFAELLDRLAYEPGRNNKLRLITGYFREVGDPDRGYALAALTGALSFKHAKPGLIRDLIMERSDPVLFGYSYDYVGDLSETVALMWPKAVRTGQINPPPPTLSEVIITLRTLGKTELPSQLARWLDELDETGRWALLKLVTGALRIGISARLAKTAAANLGGKDPHDIELLWPGLFPPYLELFAWLEGRSDRPLNRDPAAFRPVMLAHAIDDADFQNLNAADYVAEIGGFRRTILHAFHVALEPMTFELSQNLIQASASKLHLVERLDGCKPRDAALIGFAAAAPIRATGYFAAGHRTISRPAA